MVQASTGRPERALNSHAQPSVRETELCVGPEPEDSDETGAYQRLGMPVTLGCSNHDLSGEFFNWLYPAGNC